VEVLLIGLSIGFVFLMIVGVLGLIQPSLVKQQTRTKVFLTYIIPAFVIFIAIGIMAPKNTPANIDNQNIPLSERYGDPSANTPANIDNQNIPDSIDYKIIRDEESVLHIKRVVEVLLPERVDESTLKVLAEKIYKDGFERTFIGYRINGEDKDGAYWATTNYDPDLKITFIGLKKAAHNDLIKSELQVDGELIGKWLVNYGFEYKTAFYKKGDQVMIKTAFDDGSSEDVKLSSNEINGQVRYYDEGGKERGEYYIIASNGDLQFWSKNGNYYTAPKGF